MSKKKTKRITIKEIVDAFYAGESVEKIRKMTDRLVKQENSRIPTSSYKER
jgi:hypothetical protein